VKKLAVIIPHLNEEEEVIETIKSINHTSDPNLIEIITIDDCSSGRTDLGDFHNVRQIRNETRMGVDFSRQLGVESSQSKYCLVIDGHMRFKNDDWANKMLKYIDDNPETMWCTVCLGLGYGTMDVNKHMGKYFAADLKMVTDAEKNRPCRNIIEPQWTGPKDPTEYDVACILGANYFFSKDWFMYIRGLKGLQMWGTSEPFLSLKTWMAGRKCKITKDIEIGHKFRDNAPYATGVTYLVYNKIFLCKTILPDDLSNRLIGFMPKDGNYNEAMKKIDQNKTLIEEHRKYYQSIFKSSIYDFCNKFGIHLP